MAHLSICESVMSTMHSGRQNRRSKLFSRLLHLPQFLQFAALSGGCWILDTATLLLLSRAGHFTPAVANTISSCMAAGIVFLVSRHHIHCGTQAGASGRTAVYIAYTLILIFAASALLSALTKHLAPLGLTGLSGERLLFVAKVIVTPPQLICNFFVSRFVARYTFPSSKT